MPSILCVGHAVEDHLFRVEQIPTTASKHQAKGFDIVGGGPAANAAVAIARLGGDVALAARVGDDAVGESIIADLIAEGVDCSSIKRWPDHRSSLSAVMVDDKGQRMIVNYLDSDMPTDPAWLLEGFPNGLQAVLADTRWPNGSEAALKQARILGIPGVLDADHPIPRQGELLSSASHIAFSAQGLTAYTGNTNLQAAVKSIAHQLGRWCCVTDGEQGVFVCEGQTEEQASYHVNALQVEVVDTLGAGDVWHGAFCFQLIRSAQSDPGKRERLAVEFANATAALKVMRPGGRKGAPSLSDVEHFMQVTQERLN